MEPSGPRAHHLLGTDGLGRDVLSRLIVGARAAVVGPLLVASTTVVIGTVLGVLAAMRAGVVDMLISRFVELVYAMPALLMAIVVVGILQGGYFVALGVFVFFSVPTAIRLVRSAALAQIGLPYLDAARTVDVGETRLLFMHLVPNVLSTVVTTFLLDYVGALVGLSSLSFLGLGVTPGHADWGLMLAENRNVLDLSPWASLAPVLGIILTASAVTILGDRAYDRLTVGRGR